MKLSQLKAFKVVAETGKISVAAQELYISPPALSTTISGLEEELGVALFNRTSNRIILNEQGKIFLRYVNQVFNNLDCAKLEIQESLHNQEKNIRIGVTTSNIWAALISAFTCEYPQIMLSCTTLRMSQLHNVSLSRMYSFVLAEHNDFCDANMESVCLFVEHPVAIIPSGHPLAGRKMIELEDLIDEILFLPALDHSLSMRINQLFSAHQIPLKHTHECSDGISRAMVAEGRGIAITATHTGPTNTSTQRYVPINAPNCRWEQHLYWNKEKVLTAEEALFKDFVVKMYSHRDEVGDIQPPTK